MENVREHCNVTLPTINASPANKVGPSFLQLTAQILLVIALLSLNKESAKHASMDTN